MTLRRLSYLFLGICAAVSPACSDKDSPGSGDDTGTGSDSSESGSSANDDDPPGTTNEVTGGDGDGALPGSGGTLNESGGTSGSGGGSSSGSGGSSSSGGAGALPPGHLAPHCVQPDSGELFCVENANGTPGETVDLPYYFYYSAPYDGLASGTANLELPSGFSLLNPIEQSPEICGFQTTSGSQISLVFNPIDWHFQQGTDCPMTATDPQAHFLEIAIDASVAPGDYELAIVSSTMSGATAGAPTIPPGPHDTLRATIRVLAN